MREIHLLENNAACAKYVLNRTSQGFLPETFLGIGSFSTRVPVSGSGLSIYSTPTFFENEISDSIVQGYFSVFEKESLLMQVAMGEIANFPISRWLLIGQHLSIFHSSKIDVKRYLPTDELLNVRSAEEFMQVYLGNIFPHIQEIRAQSILFLFDVKMFSDYIKSFFLWLAEQFNIPFLKDLVSESSEIEMQKKVTDEFLWYLSESAIHPCIAVYPSSYNCYLDLIQSARNIRKQGNYSDELFFKL
ncbi:hypothetical protein [Silvanigrella sp.]|jgi:hypothetical protein|uniref:hypothetical protein n=1 Tax=Silvanigrella sp. TaxID=2024976 RepID=UPI0037CB1374